MNNNTVEVLKEHLVPYLAGKGVDVSSRNFRCISGLHEDKNPSCGIIPGSKGTVFHCFSCLTSGNIFTAAHFLDGLPIEGPDFWKVTVPALADQMGVEYTPEEVSPADRERYQLLAAHRDAADIILSSIDRPTSAIHRYAADRKWTIDTLRDCGIGCIDSQEDYVSTMKSLGWSEEYMRKSHLLDWGMFNPKNMIFILRDANSRPIGFAARDMSWTEGDKKPKYINSPESPIYSKATTLYLLDKCLREEGPLWVVEGYADVVSMRQAGMKRVCAIGGIYFTGPDEMHTAGANHLDILLDNDLTNVILCLDGDESGKRGTTKALSEHFPKAPTIMVMVCPLDDQDPDDIIKEKGAEGLTSIPLMSPFSWKLAGITHTSDPKQIVEDMIPLIVQEPNNITRWEMCKDLSYKTSIPVTVISEEVTSRASTDKDEARRKISGLVKDLQRRLAGVRDPDATVGLVTDTGTRMSKILDDGASKKRITYAEKVSSARNFVMDPKTGRRLNIGKYRQLESALKGFPTDAQHIILAGNPNVGKSSFFRNFSWELVRSNDDAYVIYMSIDDSFQRAIQGYVSLYTQIDQEEIIDKGLLLNNPAKKEAVWTGFDYIQKLEGKLLIQDMRDGDTITAVGRTVRTAVQKYPEKKIVLILDSFNKLTEVSSSLDYPGKVAEACDRIKKITVEYSVPIIMNVEFRKTDWMGRPTLRDLKGTMGIEYDADLVMIMHQNLHQDRDSRMIWNPGNGKGPQPVNELEIVKNKITGYKGSIFYKFLTSRSRMDEMAETAASLLLEEEKKRVQRRGRIDYDKRKAGRGTVSGAQQAPPDVEGPGGQPTG